MTSYWSAMCGEGDKENSHCAVMQIGGAKEIIDELGRRNAASLSESMDNHYVEEDTGRKIGIAKEGNGILPQRFVSLHST